MKRSFLFLTVVAFLFSAACKNASDNINDTTQAATDKGKHQSDTANYTTAKWSDSSQNFGNVLRGKQVKIVFHVTNTGSEPMFISEARPSCGCTVADFTKNAIAPGASGEVMANFDSNHGNPGHVHKTITVTSNTNPIHTTLIFEGDVEKQGS